MLPDAVWILKQIESEQGWYRFPKVLVDAIDNLRLHSYPLLYTSEAAIGNMLYKSHLYNRGAAAVRRSI